MDRSPQEPFPEPNDLPPLTRERLQKFARVMGCTEEQALDGMMASLMDLMDHPEHDNLGGFALEARKRLYGK